MIHDARTDAVGNTIRARIAVIGGGASGITLAQRLAQKMDGVLLIESGGHSIDGPTQNLAAGRSIGVPYFDLLSTRLRYYGGSTNHWSGYCRINQPLDYIARPEIDILPWPITAAAFRPYLDEAARSLGLNTDFENLSALLQAGGLDPASIIENRPGYSGDVQTRVFQIARNRTLAKRYEPGVAPLGGLRRLFFLNATDIVPQGPNSSRIDHIKAQTLTGKTVEIRADAYVIACHGIENARLLLDSTQASPFGVGNTHGLVGKHFSEHILLPYARLVPSAAFAPLYDASLAYSTSVSPHLSLSQTIMQRHKVLNSYTRFVPYRSQPETRAALLSLQSSLFRPFSAGVMADMATALQDLEGVANIAAHKLSPGWKRPPFFDVIQRIEQAPNPASRVVLSARRNALGQRQADLDWQLSPLDLRTIEVARDITTKEVSALGLGRVQQLQLSRSELESRMEGTHHQMGTTRAALRPQDGVVDFDCRVHGLDNLYIAGSSVFPHPGDASPTLALIAMAMRLGDHLLGRYG